MATNEQRDTANRINAYKEEQALQANLSEILQKQMDGRTREGRILKENAATILESKDLESKLVAITEAKEKVISEVYDKNRDLADSMLEQLETAEKLAKTEKERKDLTNEINDIGKEFGDNLASSLGISSDLVDAFRAGTAAALGFFVMKQVLGFITDSVGRMKDLNKEMGASVGNTLKMQGNLAAARGMVNPLLYSTEEVNASMQAIVKATGDFNKATPTAIANVTEMASLMEGGADAAVSLNRTLTNTGIDSAKLTENVTKMANKMGQDAGPAMDYLAANQLELNGMSEEQILLKAKEALEMKKMGVDMQKMVDLASEQLDIESSLKNEMKLRAMTGKDISMDELRAAQASGDAFAVAQAQKKLVDQLGGSLEGNLQVQRMISDATGMSKEEMLNLRNASMEQATAMADGSGEAENQAGIFDSILGSMDLILFGATALIGVLMLMGKIPMPKFLKGGGMGKGLRGLSMGLASLANPAALLGLAALTVAMIGLGFALKLAAPAFEAIGKAIATVVKSMGEFIIGFAEIASTDKVLAMLGLAASFGAVAAALLAFGSAGIFAMPAMAAVGMFTATMSALGMSGGGGGESGGDSELISEIKGLRSDIQSQPILINVDGRVVSQITKVQNRKNSTRTSGYGG